MPDDLKILVYISASSGEETEEELEAILRRSRDTNRNRGITGMLLYFEGHIMQILEGPVEAVDKLYQRISQDSRHQNVTLMYEGKLEERLFPEFSMGYKPLRSVEFTSIGSFDCTPYLHPMIREESMDKLKPEIRELIQSFRKVVGIDT